MDRFEAPPPLGWEAPLPQRVAVSYTPTVSFLLHLRLQRLETATSCSNRFSNNGQRCYTRASVASLFFKCCPPIPPHG